MIGQAELDEIARRKKEDPLVPDDEGAKGDGDEQFSADKSQQDEKERGGQATKVNAKIIGNES